MEPNPQVTPDRPRAALRLTSTTQIAAPVVVPDYKGGEKRLALAAPKETCTTKTRQNSPLRIGVGSPACGRLGQKIQVTPSSAPLPSTSLRGGPSYFPLMSSLSVSRCSSLLNGGNATAVARTK